MSNQVAVKENEDERPDVREDRIEFCAELVLRVLKSDRTPRTWRDVAVNAVYEYRKNRQSYIDADVSGILSRTDGGDWWVRRSYITNAKTRAGIRDILAQTGDYIAAVVGEGIYLADNLRDIQNDHTRNVKMIKTRASRMSFRANAMNDSKHTNLPLVTTQALLPNGEVVS